MRDLLERAAQHLLADQLGEQHLLRWSEASSGGKQNGPSGSELASALDQRLDPSPLRARDREDLVPDGQLGRRCNAAATSAREQRSTLLTPHHDRHPGTGQQSRDEAVAGADPLDRR